MAFGFHAQYYEIVLNRGWRHFFFCDIDTDISLIILLLNKLFLVLECILRYI